MSTLTKMTRTVKKLEVPRPLKSTSGTIHTRSSVMDLKINSVDDLIVLTQTVAVQISSGNHDRCFQANVALMYQHLKLHGAQLESMYKHLLDTFFYIFRNGSQDEKLDKRSRLHLLELIELRAKMWQETDTMSHYYSDRVTHAEPALLATADGTVSGESAPCALAAPPSPVEAPAPLLLGPGEIIKTSGKFVKPTKIPGKNYSKDEVVIRNADSGKVMGIKGRRVHMIEELSDTIISFQRVSPGAKERLVQITGPNEENVNHAKHLIGDTIRRNASPVRLEGTTAANLGDSTSSLNSSASEESGRPALLSHPPMSSSSRPLLHSLSTNDIMLGEFRFTISVGSSHYIKLIGNNLHIVNEAKLLLEERFGNFNESQLPVCEIGDFYRLAQKPSGNGGLLLNHESNSSDETFRANGLPSPVDDEVFVKNTSEERSAEYNNTCDRRFPRSMSLSEKKEADRSVGKLSYSNEMILHYSKSPLSSLPPNFEVPPNLLRKTSLQFNGELYLQNQAALGQANAANVGEEVRDSPEPE